MPDNAIDARDLAEERAVEFSQDFGGSEFFEDDFIRIVEQIFDIACVLFGAEHATCSFDELVRRSFSRSEGSWRAILESEYHGIYSETRLGELVHDLTAYADYGIVVSPARTPEHREQLLEEQVAQASRLLTLFPPEDWDVAGGPLERVLRKAIARWKIDNDNFVDASELALLAGRALQTIRNNLGRTGKPITGNQRRIEAPDALDWLATQKNFRASIWRAQEDAEVVAEMDHGVGEVAFVPVASDGTIFHPGLKRDGSYLIDADGREESVTDFDEALRRLQVMLHPQWRRPTPAGTWTRVRGVDWRRIPLDELWEMTGRAAS